MIALTRAVPRSINECELTHLRRDWIEVSVAVEEHRRYELALEELGCAIHRLPAAPDQPDSVFVEDIAVALDEVAIITRPGAVSRRKETAGAARIIGELRPLVLMQAPATMDGGDVLRVGRILYVGLSARTNDAGLRQLEDSVAPHGYLVRAVPVHDCLHLKSAVTEVGEGTVLLNPSWIDRHALDGLEVVEIDPGEPFAANALRIGGTVLYPARYPRTRERLELSGIAVRTVDAGELSKAEGALTCCCIVLDETVAATPSEDE